MLRYLGGEEAYDVYMAAKINQWIGATPSAPAIDVNRLRIYKALIEELKQQYAESGHYNITTVKRGLNTTTVMVEAPPTPLELAARRFFDDWIAGITTAIDAQYR
jgi:hypothetical protein